MTFLYKGPAQRGAVWAEQFARRMPQLPFRTWPEIGDPAQVRFLAAWEPPPRIAEALPNLEVLFSVGAGVDQFADSTGELKGLDDPNFKGLV